MVLLAEAAAADLLRHRLVQRYIGARHQGTIAWTVIAGATVTFVGGMIFVFVDPALHGPGYAVSTIGLLVVGVALLATMWYGALSGRRLG